MLESKLPPTVISPIPSIGEIMVPSPQSKIKVNVVHVGLSPPLVFLKVPQPSKDQDSNPSQSNNSSIVVDQKDTNVKDVPVHGLNGLPVMLRIMVLLPKVNILTKLLKETVQLIVVITKSVVITS